MEGVDYMSEKRWEVTLDMLSMLRLIRSNCQLCSDCAWCPFESHKKRELCMFGVRLPEAWDLEGMEAERDG